MKDLRSRRGRLALALAVAIIGAALVHAELVNYFSTMHVLPVIEALVFYGLVFGLAYWIAPKWG